MERPFIAMMGQVLDKEAETIVKRACMYKGDKRMTIGVDDVKFAYDGEVFGARED